jgi:hypothetical protein
MPMPADLGEPTFEIPGLYQHHRTLNLATLDHCQRGLLSNAPRCGRLVPQGGWVEIAGVRPPRRPLGAMSTRPMHPRIFT